MSTTRLGFLIGVSAVLLAIGISVVFAQSANGRSESVKEPAHASDHPRRVAGTRKGLTNVLELTPGILSGSQPDGDTGFQSLAQMGVHTVVSVDGGQPDVDRAAKYGLRYIHIPVGYDGISENSGLQLARLVQEAEFPLYIHCHHGKHRGPAAAAVACIAAGRLDHPTAIEALQLAGTSPQYGGLWRDVSDYHAPPPEKPLPELVSRAEVNSLVAAMAQLDRAVDHLDLCQAAGWQPPEAHPDIAPRQEALIVREAIHEAKRTLPEEYPEQVGEWLAAAEKEARRLESCLESSQLVCASQSLTTLKATCQRCHQRYRDGSPPPSP